MGEGPVTAAHLEEGTSSGCDYPEYWKTVARSCLVMAVQDVMIDAAVALSYTG